MKNILEIIRAAGTKTLIPLLATLGLEARAAGLAYQDWYEVPTNMTTDVPVACASYLNNLLLFARRDIDQRVVYNAFDGTNWSAWAEVPPGGATSDAALGGPLVGHRLL